MNKRQRRIREERRRHGARRAATLFVGLAAAGLVAAALPALAADDAVRVADIRPGAEGSAPDLLTNVGGTLYFEADDGTSGKELWRSEGTAASTTMVKDTNPGSACCGRMDWLTNVGGTLYFSAYDGTSGDELWKVTDKPRLTSPRRG